MPFLINLIYLIKSMQIKDLKSKQARVFSVLHADSDLLMRKIISNVFANEAFQLDSAANGKEAFAFLKARDYQYDIIITEMHMQYANGYEIINKVMKESPRTRTIITSNMSYLHIREGLEIVREDCFKKPLIVGKLLERVQYIVRGDRDADEKSSPEIERELADVVNNPLPVAGVPGVLCESIFHESKTADFVQSRKLSDEHEKVHVSETLGMAEMTGMEKLLEVKEIVDVPEMSGLKELLEAGEIAHVQEAVKNVQKSPVMSGKRWW